MNNTILVVAAHPDDEVLGCGGTIARHVVEGDKVHVLFMSDGETSRIYTNSREVEERQQVAIDASIVLGLRSKPIFLKLPDNRMDTVALLDIVKMLEKVINEIGPKVVYTHCLSDLNIDHKITHQAVMTACRPQPGFCVQEIYSFEVLSSTGWDSFSTESAFTPNVFIDIIKVWKKKVKALRCYDHEVRDFPHARSYKSVEALAVYRGSGVGIECAEAFQLERKIKHTTV
jgi:N-acetylglucosamine malate deacetylase 1